MNSADDAPTTPSPEPPPARTPAARASRPRTVPTDAPSTAPRRRPSPRSAVSVLAVTIASGLLFTVSALTSRQESAPADLVALVHESQARVGDLEQQTSGLLARIDSYADAEAAPPIDTVPALAVAEVAGPGVTITLTDAPPGSAPDNATPNDLVIHQQDIEDVMNALWDGGAEALAVQGVRITSRTVIRCIGNVILVDGVSYSPPYVIDAIGDPQALAQSVSSNPRIVNYQRYVALYGLGWDMKTRDSLILPASAQDQTTTYAQVVNADG
ncbi:DUF881 domain-containing protein [Actinomyces sp. B33]|uniref:DUF881 domain-containing protein n=1 Tax=Actinomyces sp. B33 TaxID=2942131 RepID=UPI0023406323|nr:DUF881 domain-containing protein [Actinomyces sp. B33]MDC4233965.1 DUF881 domain-containing protein [Actinomyces sp. B33]